jgi:hypothetical protein
MTPSLFYLVSNIIKHYRIYNMQFMEKIMLPDFMQVLDSLWKHPTKNEYFSKHILFTIIYLL